MPTRYDEDDDLPAAGGPDREISLGTGTVLAIFLAMALVCSLFFGLGYSMGRKSAPANPLATAAPSSSFWSGSRNSSAAPTSGIDATPPENQVTQPLEESASGRPAAAPARTSNSVTLNPVIPSEVEGPASALSHRHLSGSKPSPNAAVLPVLPVPVPTPTGLPADLATQSFVQVAAVSRKEDADLLLAALKRRGYTGFIRQQPQSKPPDQLLHIQVGPFATKKDAEVMRQRLITDGYNPILK